MTEIHDSTAAPARDRPPKKAERRGLPFRVALFYRQVVAELRKVIWPTRNELVTYTSVVVVFVTIMIAIVFSLDYLFGKSILVIFG
ncbi:MAG: preprotein translocase subunit SecE [Carbonactinosporaceae bacterium]